MLRCLDLDPELLGLLTTDDMEADVHAVSLPTVRRDRMLQLLKHYRRRYSTGEAGQHQSVINKKIMYILLFMIKTSRHARYTSSQAGVGLLTKTLCSCPSKLGSACHPSAHTDGAGKPVLLSCNANTPLLHACHAFLLQSSASDQPGGHSRRPLTRHVLGGGGDSFRRRSSCTRCPTLSTPASASCVPSCIGSTRGA